MRSTIRLMGTAAVFFGALCGARVVRARDLGDILVEKGLITPQELAEVRAQEQAERAKSAPAAAAAPQAAPGTVTTTSAPTATTTTTTTTAAAAAPTEQSIKAAIAAKLPKWLDAFTPIGDIRTRYEGFWQDGVEARNRFRLRARLGFNMKLSDELNGTIRVATGNPSDPISTNQTMDSTFSRKPFNLDLAYLQVKPGATFHMKPGLLTISGGKLPLNLLQRYSELVFDDDLTPEGAVETLTLVDRTSGTLRSLKVHAAQWSVDEVADGADPWMGGGQIVADTSLGEDVELLTSFADYHWSDMNAVARRYLDPKSSSFNSRLQNSNALRKNADGDVTGYATNFNVLNAGALLDFRVLGYPAGLYTDLAYNTQAGSRNFGFAVGAGIGSRTQNFYGKDYYHDALRDQGDWGVSYTFERIEQNAVVSIFGFSDLEYTNPGGSQRGATNVVANILRGDYVLLPHLQLTAKLLVINALDGSKSVVSLDGNPTLVRSQLDAQLTF